MIIDNAELLFMAHSYAAAWKTEEQKEAAMMSFVHGARWAEAKLQQTNVMPSLLDFKMMRVKAGLTLREVEEKTGISNAYLSQLENGKIKKPSFDVIQKLNNVYVDSNGA